MGDFLIHSHYTPPMIEGTWLDRGIKGNFRCGTCKACKFIHKANSFTNPTTGIEYTSRHFSNCKTKGVVYLARCDCPLLYVGKTTRELRRRILEHVGDINHSRDTPIAKHMRSTHENAPLAITFWVLEVVRPNERRGNLDRLLLQKETAWIYRLKTVSPRGLNDTLSFTSYI